MVLVVLLCVLAALLAIGHCILVRRVVRMEGRIAELEKSDINNLRLFGMSLKAQVAQTQQLEIVRKVIRAVVDHILNAEGKKCRKRR